MENIRLIYINIHCVISFQSTAVNIILDRSDLVVHKQFFPVYAPGKSTDPVIHSNDIGIERADKIVQGGKGGDLSAGSHVDIYAESSQTGLRMIFRISMDRHMALIQMSYLGASRRDHGSFPDQQGDRSPLGFIILLGDVQHLCAYHICKCGQYGPEPVRIILLVNIGNIVFLLSGRLGITDVINIKAQRLR